MLNSGIQTRTHNSDSSYVGQTQKQLKGTLR
eukprot:COSAG02_NODE_63991_length_261_cov_1.913580_1_plen_30_part_10